MTRNELGFDRLFAVCMLWQQGPFSELARSWGFEEAGGDAVYRSGCRSWASHHRDLRVHPPTDLAALTCRVLGALGERKF